MEKSKSKVDFKPPVSKKKKMLLESNPSLFEVFTSYQVELDTRNDRHERLVKLSRDVTIHSKRAIFCLLRRQEETVIEAERKIEEIQALLCKISEELYGEDPYRHMRAISPGLEEFVEAISLLHFLKNKKIITYEETLTTYFNGKSNSLLTLVDYMNGIADLTGELMRLAINSVGSGDFDIIEEICIVLRQTYLEFSMFTHTPRDMSRKIKTMKQSLSKVENACYNLRVRGTEIPKHLLADIFKVQKSELDSD